MKLYGKMSALALLMMLVATATAQEKRPPSQPNVAGAGAAPLMVIESFTHDFGEVKAGTPLRYAFRIKNQGKADLLIINVAPG